MFPKDQGTSWDNHGLRCAEKVIQEIPRATTVSSFMYLLSLITLQHAHTVWDIIFLICLRSSSCAGSVLWMAHKSAVDCRFHSDFLKILQKTLECPCYCKSTKTQFLTGKRKIAKTKTKKQGKQKLPLVQRLRKEKKINVLLLSRRKTDCWWYRLGTRTLFINCWKLNYSSGVTVKTVSLSSEETMKLGRRGKPIWIGELGKRCALFLIWLVTEMISWYHNWAFSN